MHAWWGGLSALNRGFFCAAVFFGVLFVWQLLATLAGLGGDDVADGDVTVDDVTGGDAAETMSAFKLLSIRSVVTFFTLFSWGGALYLADGRSVRAAIGLGGLWGVAGMAVVALLLYVLPKLAHTGTLNLATAVGAAGSVYIDIPEGGEGEIRTEVDGVMSHVKARASDGQAVKAGTAVVVERVVFGNRVEVRAVEGARG
ncbi:MAG TPA: hypothetical protein P5527_10410 [Kiritimatiellia bacterium]|nr:hypothetical protein [Kiritimatiellia bacterium]